MTSVTHQFCYAITHLKKLNDEINSDSEQTFNENPCSYTEDLTESSQILDNCENFKSKYVTQLLNDNQNNFNTYFYNIDGNKSNFNVFAAELKKLLPTFQSLECLKQMLTLIKEPFILCRITTVFTVTN